MVLQRDNGKSCVAGSSQAQALTCTTKSGGKSPGTTRTRAFFQTGEAFQKEPFPPLRYYVTARAQSRGDFAVFQSFGSHQDDFGALDLKIRQRIFRRPPAQFGSLGRRQVNWECADSRHRGTSCWQNPTGATRIAILKYVGVFMK